MIFSEFLKAHENGGAFQFDNPLDGADPILIHIDPKPDDLELHWWMFVRMDTNKDSFHPDSKTKPKMLKNNFFQCLKCGFYGANLNTEKKEFPPESRPGTVSNCVEYATTKVMEE